MAELAKWPNYPDLHGEKFVSKLYYFHKKIHYFFTDAGTHSKSRIFTILNSTFCDGRKNNKNYYFK